MITEQGYIPQLVRCFEEEGVRPVPIFINGIEAHTVVILMPSRCLALPAFAPWLYHQESCICLADFASLGTSVRGLLPGLICGSADFAGHA